MKSDWHALRIADRWAEVGWALSPVDGHIVSATIESVRKQSLQTAASFIQFSQVEQPSCKSLNSTCRCSHVKPRKDSSRAPPDPRKANKEGLTHHVAGDTNPSAGEARDPGGIIPLRWATSFGNPGRHYPVIPGRLRRNRHIACRLGNSSPNSAVFPAYIYANHPPNTLPSHSRLKGRDTDTRR
jgi:hypothetical protein